MVARVLSKSFFLLAALVVISCGIYPGVLWVLGQTCFPFQANGSILYDAHNKPVGSKLIAQPFTQDQYFHPRPSAANYNAAASASSALAASNYALRDRIARQLGTVVKKQNGQLVKAVPGDLVTTSASGLDPHISLQNAEYQLDRVAAKWARDLQRDPREVRAEIEQVLKENAFAPLGGLAGEKIVNVLEVNLALRKKFAAAKFS